MSKIDVTRRFSEVMKNKDNYLSVSLPIVSDGQEIIFFYYAKSKGSSVSLIELKDIVFRDIKTSNISVNNAIDIFSEEELDEYSSSREIECITGTRALECVKKYYDLHEKLMGFGFGENLSIGEVAQLKEYYRLFCEIVPGSKLQSIYYRLGKSLFDYLRRHIG